jgi:hypothetical protein
VSAENLQSTATWTPAHAMTEKINDFRRPSGAAGSRIRDLGRLCSEGLTLAGSISTLPALETELHSWGYALRGQFLEIPLMPSVSVNRSLSSVWARARPHGHRRNQPLAVNLLRV